MSDEAPRPFVNPSLSSKLMPRPVKAGWWFALRVADSLLICSTVFPRVDEYPDGRVLRPGVDFDVVMAEEAASGVDLPNIFLTPPKKLVMLFKCFCVTRNVEFMLSRLLSTLVSFSP